ncbi:hypothetical protein E3U43_008135%2C partial [Xyrichtys novacula]|uniref:Uncharacterized protein n=1 Tax=Xyrichtys novacula TaxID=13765 RepID=A0AAV1EYV1_XYRNO|nr:hypothetical protein E3U43_008135%2C partial [Xyrichtys novacula]
MEVEDAKKSGNAKKKKKATLALSRHVLRFSHKRRWQEDEQTTEFSLRKLLCNPADPKAVWFSLPGGWAETKYLTGREGGKLKLETGPFNLHGDFQIEWSRRLNGQTVDHTLIDCDAKCAPSNGPEDKLHLNTTSGALTLQLLSPADSGLYVGFITEDNSNVHQYIYNVTVQETPPEVTENHRNHNALFVSIGLFGFVVIGLLVAILLGVKAKTLEKKKVNAQSV